MQLSRKLKLIQEKKKRTLHVTMPHTIRDKEDVAKLFTGTFEVKLPREKKRFCHVVFPSVSEKLKNLHAAKNTLVNGKRVVVVSAHTTIQRDTKRVRKKIVMPKVQMDKKITQTLFVSNIKCGTKLQELKQAFEGCTSAKMLKPYTQHLRSAMVKLPNIHIAAEYLTEAREWPVVRGNKLILKPDKRKKHVKRKKTNKSLKIYNGKSMEEEKSNEQEEDITSDNIESDEEM